MKYLLFLIILIFGTSLSAQDTFSKKIDLDSSALWNFTKDIKLGNNTIYMLSAQFCDHNTEYIECGSITKFNLEGEIVSNITIDSIYPLSNCSDCLEYSGNRLLLSTNQHLPPYRNTSIYSFNSDMSFSKSTDYIGSMPSKTGAMGINTILGDLYSINHVTNKYALPDSIQIIKIDDAENEIWRKYYTNDNASLKVNGLQGTPDGNLAFTLELSGPQGPDDYFDGYHIMKIDTSGVVLDSFVVEESDKQPNRLLVASDGSYYFGTSQNPLNPDDLFFGHFGAINKVNPNMDSIEWVFRMPSNLLTNGRTYELYDFLEAKNGDIIVCGTVYDNTDTELETGIPGRNSTWNGFIIRLSSDGVMKWLRLYKHSNDLLPHDEYGKFRPSKLDKIKELPDGRLVGAGNVYVNNRQFSGINETETEGFHLWLIMVDENGCLEGEECEEIIRIDGKNNPSEKYLSIIKSGQRWISQKGQAGAPESFQYIYAEDSIWHNSRYYFHRIQSDNLDGSDPYIEGLYREKDGRLFYKFEGSTFESIVLDMNLEIGNEFTNSFTIGNLVVTKVDTVTLADNVPRKRIRLECEEYEDDPVYWIEGIGELQGGTYCAIDGLDKQLRCVIDEDGNTVFSSIDQDEECWIITSTDESNHVDFSISPNPTRSKIKIGINVIVKKVEIYTIDGQMLKEIVREKIIDMTPFQPGIYYLKIYTNEGMGVESVIKI